MLLTYDAKLFYLNITLFGCYVI